MTSSNNGRWRPENAPPKHREKVFETLQIKVETSFETSKIKVETSTIGFETQKNWEVLETLTNGLKP